MSIQELEQEVKKIEDQISCLNAISQADEKQRLTKEIQTMQRSVYSTITPWDKVYLARHQLRPNSLFYINEIFTDFVELSGDRLFGDDKSIVGGVAMLDSQPVTVIAQVKGKTLEENLERNFGMPNPEGYRKAMRLARQAEKFNRPIVTFIDTPGAYPGMGAEERGQAEAIARNLLEFMELKVPIIAVVIGEGGSGGALALSISDRILMLEHSVYSILSPEGFATILWKDSTKAPEAAGMMKLTAQDLHEFGVIDTIIKEPLGGIHKWTDYVTEQISKELIEQISQLSKLRKPQLLQNRYKKFRSIGKDFT